MNDLPILHQSVWGEEVNGQEGSYGSAVRIDVEESLEHYMEESTAGSYCSFQTFKAQ